MANVETDQDKERLDDMWNAALEWAQEQDDYDWGTDERDYAEALDNGWVR